MTSLAHPAEVRTANVRRRLFGPVGDFLALGGSTLLLAPLLLLLPADRLEGGFLTAVVALSFVINGPHFAVSYKLFYERFNEKSAASDGDDHLHLRYRFAGIVVPVALVLALVGSIVAGSATALGYGYNAMVFFVGWHYVKQGYGMAMVDAALKRAYFDAREKRILVVNGYAAWVTAWMIGNRISDRQDYLEVPIELIAIGDGVFAVAVGVLVATTAATLGVLGKRVLHQRSTAWTGVVAYLVSLYLWMVFVAYDPLILLVVPVLHSMQYLWVVARYQKNRAAASAAASTWSRTYVWSVVVGFAMFWVVPLMLDAMVGYDTEAFGNFAFMFAAWIGINIHHYFLDNVMWRRGNREVSEHLFGSV